MQSVRLLCSGDIPNHCDTLSRGEQSPKARAGVGFETDVSLGYHGGEFNCRGVIAIEPPPYLVVRVEKGGVGRGGGLNKSAQDLQEDEREFFEPGVLGSGVDMLSQAVRGLLPRIPLTLFCTDDQGLL